MPPTTIRAQNLDGSWETIGVDSRRYGIWPDNVQIQSDGWGPSKATFELKRDGRKQWPELRAFTPIEIEVGGITPWSGRISDTPHSGGDQRTMSVSADGWQYHLDDDAIERSWVHKDLTSFVDMRSLINANLTVHTAVWDVQTGDGGIKLGVGNGQVVTPAGVACAAVLDLGPGGAADTMSMTVRSSFNTSAFFLYVMGTDTPYWPDANSGRLDYIGAATIPINWGGFGATDSNSGLAATIATPKRYFTVMLWDPSFSGTTGAEHWFKIVDLNLFVAPGATYNGVARTADRGIAIRASEVVKDALTRGAPLITASTDSSPSYKDEVLADGASGYWRLNQALGQHATDLVTYQPTNSDVESSVLPGQLGLLPAEPGTSSTRFFGGGYIRIPYGTGKFGFTGGCTIECWVNMDTVTGIQEFVRADGAFLLRNNAGAAEMYVWIGGGPLGVIAAGAFVAGKTYHVVGTYDGAAQNLYVNGVLVATTPRTGTMNTPAQPIYLGAFVGTSEFFTGRMQDVMVTYYAFSAEQVKRHWWAGGAPLRGTLTRTAFNIPAYETQGPTTPRQVWTAVDSYHGWVKKIDAQRRPVYKPLPSSPIYEVGSWSGEIDDDASANSGDDIYNKTIVTGTSPEGTIVRAPRGQSSGTTARIRSSLATGYASPGGGFTSYSGTLTPKILRGTVYQIRLLKIVVTGLTAGGSVGTISVGAPQDSDTIVYPDVAVTSNGTFGPFPFVTWTATANHDYWGFTQASGTGTGWSVYFYWELWWGGTLPERFGFNRTLTLPMQNSIPSDLAAANFVGDAQLVDHRATPLKGTVTLNGRDGIRDIYTGATVPLQNLVGATGEMIRLTDRVDPDTGGWGRDGRIVGVTYTPATDTAVLTLDNTRTVFDAFLARLAVVSG